jgi:hypothetical protein
MARSSKQQVLKAVTDYQRATRHLRTLLGEVDTGLHTFVALVKSDEAVAALLLGADAASRRREFAQAMTDFENARRRLRIAVLRLGEEQGESVADMAKALGISRQLAYRHLAEER